MAGQVLLVTARVIDRELQNGRRYGAIRRAGKGYCAECCGSGYCLAGAIGNLYEAGRTFKEP